MEATDERRTTLDLIRELEAETSRFKFVCLVVGFGPAISAG